jgi:putative oxidoreductase
MQDHADTLAAAGRVLIAALLVQSRISKISAPASCWLAAFTLAAALAIHINFADQNQIINFLTNIAIIGGLLQIIAFGPGPLSRWPPEARDGVRAQ